MGATPTTFAIPETRRPPAPEPFVSRRSVRDLLGHLLAALFLVSLFVPLVGTFRHWDLFTASNENRRLSEAPDLPANFKDVQRFSDRWLSFYRDHFGFRNTLIHAVALTRYHGLGADVDGNVVVGTDGWLFLRPDGDRNFIAFRGLNPLSDDELAAWQDVLEHRAAWLASKGIPYLVVIPPDKQTVYPEYLPPEYQRVRPISRLDQLVQRLRQTHSPLHLIDLTPALLAAKPNALLYHHTDTHWNDSGAFVGYNVIIHAVQQLLPQWRIQPQTRNDFVQGPDTPEVGDLARMMDMPDVYKDHGFALIRKIPFVIPSTLMNRNDVTVMDGQNPELPNLIFYRDSFGIALAPMLGPNFNRVVYAFHYEMDPALIEKYKPDLVISEFLERNLYLAPPTDPAEIRHFQAN